jgi:Fe-S-cluster containining protein
MRIPAIASRTFERFKDDLYFGGIFRRIFKSLENLKSATERVSFVHREIDRYIKQKFQDPAVNNNVSCKNSCAMCCHTQVSVSDDEAEVLAGKVIQLIGKGFRIDISRLRHQADIQEDDTKWYKESYLNRKCIFLDGNNACMVYEDRPSVCRSHHVVGNSDQCSTSDGVVKSQQVLITHEANMVIMAAFMFGQNNGVLAKRVWEILSSNLLKTHMKEKIIQHKKLNEPFRD